MFPLNSSTLFLLVLSGVLAATALAFRSRWPWRIPLLLLAIALPAGWLWRVSPAGEYAGLGYIIVIGASFCMMVFGAVWGGIMRRARCISPFMSAALPVIAFVSAAGFILWQQYIPRACLGKPLPVRIAGQILILPPELRPRLETGDSTGFFGRIERKADYAGFCRASRNGTRAIDVDVVWITPAANDKALTSACNANAPPAWCSGYAPDPYRHMGKIIIEPGSRLPLPLTYWKGGGSLRTERQGDLARGSVCLLPDTGRRTECWVWHPFGAGYRLTVSTSNLDPLFAGMPAEEARGMAERAREVFLAVTAP